MVPLIKLLEEDNEDLRYVTLEALGKIKSASALKAVSYAVTMIEKKELASAKNSSQSSGPMLDFNGL